ILMRRTLALALALAVGASDGRAQLVNKPGNWGLTLGLDAITGSYDPSHNRTSTGDDSYTFASRAYGVRLNAGGVFLKHILLGGDVGTALFGGDRTFNSGL